MGRWFRHIFIAALLLCLVVMILFSVAATGAAPSPPSGPAYPPEWRQPSPIDSTFPLRPGDDSWDVLVVEHHLIVLGYMTTEDGVYDTQTATAVKAYRYANGLRVNGRVPADLARRLDREATRFENIRWASDCAEMTFHRQAVGLPEPFDGLGWREANCRNEDDVRTYCCYGWWQLYPSMHSRDHRMIPKLKACGVRGYWDINSDTVTDKRRQACYAKALFDTVGYSAWAL